MNAATWVASIIGAVIVGGVLLVVFAALMLASQADDEIDRHMALLNTERDFDATGYPNAELPAVMWKDQGHE